MALHKLTPAEIKAATKPRLYGDGGGLHLKVGGTGAKSWSFRFEFQGSNTQTIGLGSIADITPGEARAEAAGFRKLLAQGINPKTHREAQRTQAAVDAAQQVTFDEVAAKFIAMRATEKHKPLPGEKVGRSKWCANYVKAWEVSLRKHVSPVFGRLPVGKIDETLVHRVLDPLRNRNEMFHQIQDRMQSILSFAIARKYRSGPNPAAWKDNLEHAAYDKRDLSGRRPALDFAELPAFVAALRKRDGKRDSVGSLAVEFIILTGVRVTEALGAEWREIEWSERDGVWVWTIPAKRMKVKSNGNHRVPLSDVALAVLEQLRDRHPRFVFPGTKGKHLNRSTTLAAVKKMRPDITPHGFRTTFKRWANTTGHVDEVSERALAHVVGSSTNRRYADRPGADKAEPFGERVKLMNEWAAYANGEVISLAARRKDAA